MITKQSFYNTILYFNKTTKLHNHIVFSRKRSKYKNSLKNPNLKFSKLKNNPAQAFGKLKFPKILICPPQVKYNSLLHHYMYYLVKHKADLLINKTCFKFFFLFCSVFGCLIKKISKFQLQSKQLNIYKPPLEQLSMQSMIIT